MSGYSDRHKKMKLDRSYFTDDANKSRIWNHARFSTCLPGSELLLLRNIL